MYHLFVVRHHDRKWPLDQRRSLVFPTISHRTPTPAVQNHNFATFITGTTCERVKGFHKGTDDATHNQQVAKWAALQRDSHHVVAVVVIFMPHHANQVSVRRMSYDAEDDILLEDVDLDDPEAPLHAVPVDTMVPNETTVPALTVLKKRQQLAQAHGGAGNSQSTLKKIGSVFKHWTNYCASNNINSTATPTFLNASTLEVDADKIVNFLYYLDDLQPTFTFSQMSNAVLFMQYHCNLERKVRGLPYESGAVKKDRTVATVLDAYRKKRANQCRVDGTDIQADLDNEISPQEMLELVHASFDPPYDSIRRIKTITRLQFCALLRQTHTTGQRSADLRAQYYNFYSTRACKYIGPIQTTMDVIIINQS